MSAELLGIAFKADSLRAEAAKKSDGRCWYCGDMDADSLEHQIPAARGGASDISNCVLACRVCNSRKRTRSVDEFRVYQMIVHGRPPEPFFGEGAKRPRDWIIVCDSPIEPPQRRDVLAARMASFLGCNP